MNDLDSLLDDFRVFGEDAYSLIRAQLDCPDMLLFSRTGEKPLRLRIDNLQYEPYNSET